MIVKRPHTIKLVHCVLCIIMYFIQLKYTVVGKFKRISVTLCVLCNTLTLYDT